jgi:hypothetical protein
VLPEVLISGNGRALLPFLQKTGYGLRRVSAFIKKRK